MISDLHLPGLHEGSSFQPNPFTPTWHAQALDRLKILANSTLLPPICRPIIAVHEVQVRGVILGLLTDVYSKQCESDNTLWAWTFVKRNPIMWGGGGALIVGFTLQSHTWSRSSSRRLATSESRGELVLAAKLRLFLIKRVYVKSFRICVVCMWLCLCYNNYVLPS